MTICEKDKCTGCGACAYACPKDCIKMSENNIGITYPEIDDSKCVNCGKCKQVCPGNNTPKLNKPIKAYAAWSIDNEERRTSASGGIAAEFYKEACRQNFSVVGAAFDDDLSVTLQMTENQEDCLKFKNSKYVFCDAKGVYPQIKKALNENKKIMVIGLPCQIAAVKKLFPDNDNILTVDLVCHGVTPDKYLKQHISKIQNETKSEISQISFRDPLLGTEFFYFSAYDKSGKRAYAKQSFNGDTYNYGYHRTISYRENCYHCSYARGERVSEITLSDYHGLGKLAPCSFSEHKVSCILVHTEKGEEFVRALTVQEKIHAEERPIQEPINGDLQLQRPSAKSRGRMIFEKKIEQFNGDFERAIAVVMKKDSRKEKLRKFKGLPRKAVRKVRRSLFG